LNLLLNLDFAFGFDFPKIELLSESRPGCPAFMDSRIETRIGALKDAVEGEGEGERILNLPG